tara:strand:- start:725 stop:961 length:237 start_codon:yes stop_codon:yes gene_type:complete
MSNEEQYNEFMLRLIASLPKLKNSVTKYKTESIYPLLDSFEEIVNKLESGYQGKLMTEISNRFENRNEVNKILLSRCK